MLTLYSSCQQQELPLPVHLLRSEFTDICTRNWIAPKYRPQASHQFSFHRKYSRRIITPASPRLQSHRLHGWQFHLERKAHCPNMWSPEKCGFVWGCQARVDAITEPIARMLGESGCQYVDLGIESFNDDILKFIKKVSHKLKSIRLLNSWKISRPRKAQHSDRNKPTGDQSYHPRYTKTRQSTQGWPSNVQYCIAISWYRILWHGTQKWMDCYRRLPAHGCAEELYSELPASFGRRNGKIVIQE